MTTLHWKWIAAAALACGVPASAAAQDEYASPILASIPHVSRLFHNPVRELAPERPAVKRVEFKTPLLSDIPYVGRLFTNVALVEADAVPAPECAEAAPMGYVNTGTPVIVCENGSCGMARMATVPVLAARANVVAEATQPAGDEACSLPVYSAVVSVGSPPPTYTPSDVAPPTPAVVSSPSEPTLQISLQEYTKLVAAVAKAEAQEELRKEFNAQATAWKTERDQLIGAIAESQGEALNAVMRIQHEVMEQRLAAMTKQVEAEAAKVAAEQTRLKELEEVLKQQIEDNAGLRAKLDASTKEHAPLPAKARMAPTTQPSLAEPESKPGATVTTY